MGVSVQTLAATQWPLCLAALAGGILFGMAGIRRANTPGDGRPGYKDTLLLLLKSIWPIALVLALSMLLRVDLIVSLLVTVAILIAVHRLRPHQLWDLARKMPFGTVPIIVGAMIFRRVLETSNAVEAASQAMANLGIPLPFVVFAVPMAAGLLTGLAVAAFAIGFPIVLPLCGPDLIGSGYGFVAYAGGFVGLMLSPVHLCLALTRIYFKAQWGGIYRQILPAAFLMVVAVAVTVALR
jgi:integral membrane protein (TIGR00529 family)